MSRKRWYGWQPIETCPENELVLLYQPGKELFDGYIEQPVLQVAMLRKDYYSPICPAGIDGYEWENEMKAPTHWMPLPLPPKGDLK